jgi:hypothetical protein
MLMGFTSASKAPSPVENQADSILDSIEFDEYFPLGQSKVSPVSPPPFSPFLPEVPFEREGAPSPEPLLKYLSQVPTAEEPNLEAQDRLDLGHGNDADERIYVGTRSLQLEADEADLSHDDHNEEKPFAPPPSPEDDYYLQGAASASGKGAAPPLVNSTPAIQTDWARVCKVCRLACGGIDNCLLRFNHLVHSLDLERRAEAQSRFGEVRENRKRRLSTDSSTTDLSLLPPVKRRKRSISEGRSLIIWNILEYQAPAGRDRSPSGTQSPEARYASPSCGSGGGYVPRSPDFSSDGGGYRLRSPEFPRTSPAFSPNPDCPHFERNSRFSSNESPDEHSSRSWSIEAVHGSDRGSEGEDEESSNVRLDVTSQAESSPEQGRQESEAEHSDLDRTPAQSPRLRQSRPPSLASPISWSEFFSGAEENQASQTDHSRYSRSSDEANYVSDSSSPSLQSPRSGTTASDDSANNGSEYPDTVDATGDSSDG